MGETREEKKKEKDSRRRRKYLLENSKVISIDGLVQEESRCRFGLILKSLSMSDKFVNM